MYTSQWLINNKNILDILDFYLWAFFGPFLPDYYMCMAISICCTHMYNCTHVDTIHADQFDPLFTEFTALETLKLCLLLTLSIIVYALTWKYPMQGTKTENDGFFGTKNVNNPPFWMTSHGGFLHKVMMYGCAHQVYIWVTSSSVIWQKRKTVPLQDILDILQRQNWPNI